MHATRGLRSAHLAHLARLATLDERLETLDCWCLGVSESAAPELQQEVRPKLGITRHADWEPEPLFCMALEWGSKRATDANSQTDTQVIVESLS